MSTSRQDGRREAKALVENAKRELRELRELRSEQRRRVRPIRITPCKRPNPDQGEEVDVSMLMNESQATVMTMSKAELMDLAIRALTYLRDESEPWREVTESRRREVAMRNEEDRW